jgi:hypothetical protein
VGGPPENRKDKRDKQKKGDTLYEALEKERVSKGLILQIEKALNPMFDKDEDAPLGIDTNP